MKKGRFFIVTGLLLIAAALILTGYNRWDSRRAAKSADEALEQILPMIKTPTVQTQPAAETAEEIEYPDYVLNPNMAMPVAVYDGREYIGVLNLPTIGCELPVISDWNDSNLSVAPCRYCGSLYLDDMVICAHNYSAFFSKLKELSYGDMVTFTDMDGNVFRYEVLEIESLLPTAVREMKSGDWDLTVFTCTVGGASRVTVRCRRLDSPAVAAQIADGSVGEFIDQYSAEH